MTALRSGSASDVGKVRTSNQDVALEDPDLFAVADGMGGHAGGEVAARVAIDTLRAAFRRDPVVEGLRRAFAEANHAVWRQGQAESGLRGMGTTLTATALVRTDGDRQVIALANVGDSRAYVFSKDQVIQVTTDHSLAEEKVRHGQLTEAEAAVHPHRHILTRALGVSSDVDVDLWELHLHVGDRILLCSDGLTNELGTEQIRAVLKQVSDPRQAARALVKEALDHGGSDNVTVIVVDVVSDDAAHAPARDVEGAPSTVRSETSPDAGHGGEPGESSDTDTASGARRGGTSNGSVQSQRNAAPASALRAGLLGVAGPDAVGAGDRAGEGDGDGDTAVAGTEEPTKVHSLRAVGEFRPRPSVAETRPSAGAAARARAVVIGGTGRTASAAAGPGAAAVTAPERGGPTGRRLHAAELRRLQPSRHDPRAGRRTSGAPRIVTFRSVLFVVLLLAVVAAAYVLVRWYATDDWYISADHGHLAVYQGRPGGFLWFKPQLVDETPVTESEVPTYALATVRRERQEPSLSAAKHLVANLHQEYVASHKLSTGSASSGSSPSATSSSATSPAARTATTAGGG